MFGMATKVQLFIGGDSSGATSAIRKVANEANRLDNVGTSRLRRFAGGLAHIGWTALKVAGAAGLGALTAAAGLLGVVLTKGFQRLTAIENATAKLRGLGHSAKEVKGLMQDALKAVKGTAYGLDEAATVMASASAAGIEGGQQMYKYLRLVADAATIANRPLAEMGSIFNKVAAGGLNGDVLRQLTDSGIPIEVWLKQAAQRRGVNAKELEKLRKAGELPQGLFFEAMQTGLGGAAIKQGNATTEGALKNVWAAVGRLGASLLGGTTGKGGVFGQIRPLLIDTIGWLDKLGERAPAIGRKVGRAFKTIVSAVREFVGRKDVQKRVKDIAEGIWNFAKAAGRFVTSEKFISTMKGIGKVLVSVGKPILKFFSTDTGAKIVGIAAALTAFSVVSKVKAAGGLFQLGLAIGKVLLPLKALGALLFTSPWGLVIAAIGIAAYLVYKNWDKVWPVLKKVGEVVWSVLSPAFKAVGAVIGFVRKHWRGLIDAFVLATGPIGSLVAWVIHHWDTFKTKVAKIWDAVRAAWDFMWEKIKQSPIGRILGAAVGAVRAAVDKIRDKWDTIKGAFVGAINWVVRNVLRPAFGWTGITFPEISTGNAYTSGNRAISAHAEGALVKKPEVALIGEDGPELVLPLTKPHRMNELLKQAGIRPYAEGGFIGNVSSFFNKMWDKAKDIPDVVGRFLSNAVRSLTNRLPRQLNNFMHITDVVSTAIERGAKRLVGALQTKFSPGGRGGGGPLHRDIPGLRGTIVNYALKQVGDPYVWGGTGPNGYDCSGLVYASYRAAGVNIPRIQVNGGRVISASQMQPADVLLYSPGVLQNGQRVPFGHYKMYIGGGRTVEATSGGVQVRGYAPAAQVRTFLADKKFSGWHGDGGSFRVTEPTIFGAGERGAEDVDITPVGRRGRRSTRTLNLNIILPGGTTLIGEAERVGEILAPHVLAKLDEMELQDSRGGL